MKKLFIFICLVVFFAAKVSAQITLTVTVTNATNCSTPCDGSAAANNVPTATYLWTPGGQTTATATGLCPGTYSVIATIATYSISGSGTGTVTCSANGVSNISVDENISVFPNPAHNELYLRINSAMQGKIAFSIINIFGQEVYEESIDTNGSLYKWVDISVLPVGIYSVEFMNGTQAIRKKFIKQ